jgi:enoyl-CoA hydratase
MAYEHIIEAREGAVGIITLNRPKALNALNSAMVDEINCALAGFAKDDAIGCVILTGNEKAFAAGADIREMKDKSFDDVYGNNFLSNWDEVPRFRKPLIAAVAGYCLGGGCEFALMCDLIIAAENAKFATPETGLGIIPGGGATQRLARWIGKSKAMDMVLTGRQVDATEAERIGLVARIVPTENYLAAAIEVAQKIASLSRPVAMMAKEAVNRAYETPLEEGLLFERRTIHSTFALEDQKEGMAAFLEKRKPAFRNR